MPTQAGGISGEMRSRFPPRFKQRDGFNWHVAIFTVLASIAAVLGVLAALDYFMR